MTLHLGDEIRRVLAECRRQRATDSYAATRISELIWEKSREIVGTFPATLDNCPACAAWAAKYAALEQRLEQEDAA